MNSQRASVDGEVAAMAGRVRLCQDPRRSGQAGMFLARGPGASLDFHDHRDYQPGDDLRFLDWNVWGRSGKAVIRRQRAENAPRLEIILDSSASMAFTPAKTLIARQLANLWLVLGEQAGARPVLWILGERPRQAIPWAPLLQRWTPQGSLGAMPPPSAGSQRIFISDGLFPEGPAQVIRCLGDGVQALHMLQVLDPTEIQPIGPGRARLIDAEQAHSAEVEADANVVEGYLRRLEGVRNAWRSGLAGRGRLVSVPATSLLTGVQQAVTAGLLTWREGR